MEAPARPRQRHCTTSLPQVHVFDIDKLILIKLKIKRYGHGSAGEARGGPTASSSKTSNVMAAHWPAARAAPSSFLRHLTGAQMATGRDTILDNRKTNLYFFFFSLLLFGDVQWIKSTNTRDNLKKEGERFWKHRTTKKKRSILSILYAKTCIGFFFHLCFFFFLSLFLFFVVFSISAAAGETPR